MKLSLEMTPAPKTNAARFRTLLMAIIAAYAWPIGLIAQTAVLAGIQSTVLSDPGITPFGVAADTKGDMYISDAFRNRVVKVAAGTGIQTTVNVSVAGLGLSLPDGVAVNADGDLFVADWGHNRVIRVPADGTQQSALGTGLSHPVGLAMFGLNYVFIADSGNNRVVLAGIEGTQSTVRTGFSRNTATVQLLVANPL